MSASENDVFKKQSRNVPLPIEVLSLFNHEKETSSAKLRHFISNGEQDEANRILLSKPDLMFVKGKLRDSSTRQFFNVSALQYAWWAGDTNMLNMMLTCILAKPNNEELRVKMIHQIKEVILNSLSYEYCGTEYTEQRYDLKPYISELEHYDLVFNQEQRYDLKPYISELEHYDLVFKQSQIENSSLQQKMIDRIRQVQRTFPTHVRQRYCNEITCFTDLDFSGGLIRTLELALIDATGLKHERVWDSDLDYFMSRNNMLVGWVARGMRRNMKFFSAAQDLRSFNAHEDDITFAQAIERSMRSGAKDFYEKLQHPLTCLQITESNSPG